MKKHNTPGQRRMCADIANEGCQMKRSWIGTAVYPPQLVARKTGETDAERPQVHPEHRTVHPLRPFRTADTGVRLLVVTCCLRPCTKQIDTGTVTGSQYQAQRQGMYATQPSAPLPLKYRRLTRAKRTRGSNFRSCSPPKRMKGEDSTS